MNPREIAKKMVALARNNAAVRRLPVNQRAEYLRLEAAFIRASNPNDEGRAALLDSEAARIEASLSTRPPARP